MADRDGSMHVLFCPEHMRVFQMLSREDGRTFSAPVEITAAFEALRPAHG